MEETSFEQAFAQLEETVQSLESGNLPLEEAMALFERGVKLAAACNSCLDAAELRLKQLVPSLDGGFEAEPWQPKDT
ncbi:MAG: exodeoxyribonuclease VII small subunit [Bacteroidetes bacterium]|nr:exodeoxyribonuclease VII small subunit [Bacteroidota bacterium]MCL5027173.1 exodeoxyribonuclease VII small subunit [Chloroflexota bacterium]